MRISGRHGGMLLLPACFSYDTAGMSLTEREKTT